MLSKLETRSSKFEFANLPVGRQVLLKFETGTFEIFYCLNVILISGFGFRISTFEFSLILRIYILLYIRQLLLQT